MPLTDYSRKTRLEKEFDFGQGVSKYYMPDTSWMTQLQEPTYLGTSGVVTEGGGLFSHGTPHWADQNIGEAKYKFDYSKLFGEDSQISSLINSIFTGRGKGQQVGGQTFWQQTGGLNPSSSQAVTTYNDDGGYYYDPSQDVIAGETGEFETAGETGSLGFGEFANIFDDKNVASLLSLIYGKDIDPSTLQKVNPLDVFRTDPKFYTPIEVGERENLLNDLVQSFTGVKTGNFAGSGSRISDLLNVRKGYGAEMEKVWEAISKARLEGVESLSEKISSWADVADLA